MTTDAKEHLKVDSVTGGLLIPLGGRKFPDMHALVDAADVPLVEHYSWHPMVTNPGSGEHEIFYAHGSTSRTTYFYMHRVIMGIFDPLMRVDHKNHNGLDNRRVNLRVASNQQNRRNSRPNLGSSSRYKGVSWRTAARKWVVTLRANGKQYRFGQFKSEEEAARVYDEAAREIFGEFAYLNFPDEEAA